VIIQLFVTCLGGYTATKMTTKYTFQIYENFLKKHQTSTKPKLGDGVPELRPMPSRSCTLYP
jgi:hypothetical protein